MNKYNFHIWASQPPHAFEQHERDFLNNLNVFCAVSKTKVYRQFFFAELTITGVVYLDKLEQWLFHQLEQDIEDIVFKQIEAPPHWHRTFVEC